MAILQITIIAIVLLAVFFLLALMYHLVNAIENSIEWRIILPLWYFKQTRIHRQLEMLADKFTPEINALAERKNKERSLPYEPFWLRRFGELHGLEEWHKIEERNRPVGWKFPVGATLIWVELRSSWPSLEFERKWMRKGELGPLRPPLGHWSVAEQFVFRVGSSEPIPVPAEETYSLSLTELSDIIDHILLKSSTRKPTDGDTAVSEAHSTVDARSLTDM